MEVLSRKVTFNKSHFWEKEDEKRLLFLNYAERLFIPISGALKAIHIGLGIPKPEHDEIFDAISGKGIKLYVMIYQHNRYERWILTQKTGNGGLLMPNIRTNADIHTHLY